MVSPRSTRQWVGALCAAVAMLFCAPLYAQSSEAALDAVRDANGHYDAGEFSQALLKYRRAYDVLEDVRLLYRIGLSYENLGNYARARETLLRYLELDTDSPVEGRVRAKIDQLRDLEENIQAYLVIDSVPAGATVFLNEYMGRAEGMAPVTMPVGAGENVVTLVFPDRQRLQVVVEVGAGATVERVFQVGSAIVAAEEPATSEEIASAEVEAIEIARPAEDSDPAETRTEESTESDPSEAPDGRMADVIPMPGSERQMDRPVQLDRISIAPPWWASTLAVMSFAASAACVAGTATGVLYVGPGAACAVLLTGSGLFLLGRDWTGNLPLASQAPGLASPRPGSGGPKVWGVSLSGSF